MPPLIRDGSRRVQVSYYQRRPRAAGNFSIEILFADLRKRLESFVDSTTVVARYRSSGLFRRLFIVFEAVLQQGDINHVTGDINFVGILLKRRRTIQTIHDCALLDQKTGVRHAIIKLFWMTLPVRRCAVVTVVSHATKKELLKHVSGCPPEKICVIPNAISQSFHAVDKRFNAAKPRILQVGTAPNKNVGRLAEALRGIACELHVIGRLHPDDEKRLTQNGIEYSSEWDLSEEETIRCYAEADLVSLVSTYEGFGMPILEAHTVGRPVITSNILSMPEVAGDAACLVDPLSVDSIREGILRIISDETYRNELISRGFENAKRYDADSIAAQYLALYRTLAGGTFSAPSYDPAR